MVNTYRERYIFNNYEMTGECGECMTAEDVKAREGGYVYRELCKSCSATC